MNNRIRRTIYAVVGCLVGMAFLSMGADLAFEMGTGGAFVGGMLGAGVGAYWVE